MCATHYRLIGWTIGRILPRVRQVNWWLCSSRWNKAAPNSARLDAAPITPDYGSTQQVILRHSRRWWLVMRSTTANWPKDWNALTMILGIVPPGWPEETRKSSLEIRLADCSGRHCSTVFITGANLARTPVQWAERCRVFTVRQATLPRDNRSKTHGKETVRVGWRRQFPDARIPR